MFVYFSPAFAFRYRSVLRPTCSAVRDWNQSKLFIMRQPEQQYHGHGRISYHLYPHIFFFQRVRGTLRTS
jgi:hypothetical protein